MQAQADCGYIVFFSHASYPSLWCLSCLRCKRICCANSTNPQKSCYFPLRALEFCRYLASSPPQETKTRMIKRSAFSLKLRAKCTRGPSWNYNITMLSFRHVFSLSMHNCILWCTCSPNLCSVIALTGSAVTVQIILQIIARRIALPVTTPGGSPHKPHHDGIPVGTRFFTALKWSICGVALLTHVWHALYVPQKTSHASPTTHTQLLDMPRRHWHIPWTDCSFTTTWHSVSTPHCGIIFQWINDTHSTMWGTCL